MYSYVQHFTNKSKHNHKLDDLITIQTIARVSLRHFLAIWFELSAENRKPRFNAYPDLRRYFPFPKKRVKLGFYCNDIQYAKSPIHKV